MSGPAHPTVAATSARTLRRLLPATCVWMVACGPSDAPPTKSPAGSGSVDTGSPAPGGSGGADSGPDPTDTGPTDTGPIDTGPTDTGTAAPTVVHNWINPHGADQAELWTRPDEWAQTAAVTDVLSLYAQAVGEDQRGHATAAIQGATRLGMEIAVEAGGTLASVGCGTDVGERSAEAELERMQTITNAGATLGWLSLDGPISRTLATGRPDNCGFTIEQSTDALARYMAAMRAAHPGVRIGWLINFPNWSYGDVASYQCATKDYGDLQVILDEVVRGLDAQGETLDYLMIDSPYDYTHGLAASNCHDDPTTVDWMGRLLALEAQARDHGMLVAQIYNSARGGATSNELFYEDTVEHIRSHHAAGGRPDIRLVSSWYTYPDVVLPETTPHTFAYTALAVFQAGE